MLRVALHHITYGIMALDLLTFSSFILIIGQLSALVALKKVYFAIVSVSAFGNLICAVSKSIPVLVLGRAIVGCGGGG